MSEGSERLTVGVIARDSQGTLDRCLRSIFGLAMPADVALNVILVDSGSSDRTTQIMLEQARTDHRVRVLRVDGQQNAAVARNVILNEAAEGPVLLLDGDIVLHPDFAVAAIGAIREHGAAAVTGPLVDVLIEEGGRRRQRKQPKGPYPRSIRQAGGNLMLSATAAASMRFDEGLRRNEDFDFALRLSDAGPLLFIECPLGDHLTVDYFSKDRVRTWITQAYPAPTGALLRKHSHNFVSVVQILTNEKGMVLGAVLQAVAILGAAIGSPLSLVAIGILLADFGRFSLQKRAREFFPVRILAPWLVAYGFFREKRVAPSYSVARLVT
jgi:glycosyltransferase involved in cell wall biosynthesis